MNTLSALYPWSTNPYDMFYSSLSLLPVSNTIMVLILLAHGLHIKNKKTNIQTTDLYLFKIFNRLYQET